ncbi:MAG: hypothetical protein PHI12_12280 [Dehalococcoidales bacterium]|jgi:hypothetical protein|nr:hypothetical protein [Dehalococcoidales bacterium]
MAIVDEMELQVIEARKQLEEAKKGLSIMADAGVNITSQKARLKDAERQLQKLERSIDKARREEV